jgi:methylmalonyl-CoA mutase
MRPDFTKIDYRPSQIEKSKTAGKTAKQSMLTPELIPLKPVYTASDLKGMEHLNYAAGLAPFLRGPYSTM